MDEKRGSRPISILTESLIVAGAWVASFCVVGWQIFYDDGDNSIPVFFSLLAAFGAALATAYGLDRIFWRKSR